MAANGKNCQLIGSNITNAKARNFGGGVEWLQGSVNCTIKDCYFYNLSAKNHGGGIHWYPGTNGQIDNCTFENVTLSMGDKELSDDEIVVKYKNTEVKRYKVLYLETDDYYGEIFRSWTSRIFKWGKSINIVPNSCITYIDFRVINNGHRQKIFEELNRLKEKYQFEYEIINDIRPFITESEKCKTTNFITRSEFYTG